MTEIRSRTRPMADIQPLPPETLIVRLAELFCKRTGFAFHGQVPGVFSGSLFFHRVPSIRHAFDIFRVAEGAF